MSTSIRGAPAVVEDARIELVFEEDDQKFITGRAGCNEIRATAELAESRVVADLMSITEVGCTDDLHARDRWLQDFFASDPQYSVSDDRLTLTSADATIELVEVDELPLP